MSKVNFSIHNNRVLGTARLGDIVKVNKKCCNHWGVYIGNDQLIHVEIQKCFQSNFTDFVQDGKADIDNYDDKWRPLNEKQIIQNAKQQLTNTMWENSKQFALFCRYGDVGKEQKVTDLQPLQWLTVLVSVAVIGVRFFVLSWLFNTSSSSI